MDCNKCGVKLQTGLNWYTSSQNNSTYTCISCHKKRGTKNYIQNKKSYIKRAILWGRTEKGKSWRREYKKLYGFINKEKLVNQARVYRKLNPWVICLANINQRCYNSKRVGYKYYGGKGIKNYLSSKDIKYLWFRDKAYLLKKPSIDRINSNKSYTMDNCRFIEMVENIRRISKGVVC